MTQLVTGNFFERLSVLRSKLGWQLWFNWVLRLPKQLRACILCRMRCRMLSATLRKNPPKKTPASKIIEAIKGDRTRNTLLMRRCHLDTIHFEPIADAFQKMTLMPQSELLVLVAYLIICLIQISSSY